MKQAFLVSLADVVAICLMAASAGVAYWATARKFVPGDEHALDGIVRDPVNEFVVFRNASIWDGRGGSVQRAQSIVVRDGHIADVVDAAAPLPADVRTIDASGKTLIPGSGGISRRFGTPRNSTEPESRLSSGQTRHSPSVISSTR